MKKRVYKKGPSKAPRAVLKRKAKGLNKLAYLSFLMAIFSFFLVNPFSSFVELADKFSNFPKNVEERTFNFFDWSETQLSSWPVLAWNNKEDSWSDKEAGQSALAELEAVDYASLDFSIEIPAIEVDEKVTSNVNPNIVSEYKTALEEGVAHAKGSAFPGQDKLVYIFGHSTDGIWNVEAYNAVFYQIKDLEMGDEIILHLGDDDFKYEVIAKDVIKSTDIDFVNNKKDENLLILQTCWPPGTSWQRLFITALPV